MENPPRLFSSTILVFDTYFIDLRKDTFNEMNIKNKNIYSNNNFVDFTTKNKIPIFNTFMQRTIDYYPVVRIFGSTLFGQKTCVNIHQYYPYFYIEINDANNFGIDNPSNIKRFAVLWENGYLSYTFAKEEEKNKEMEKRCKNNNSKNYSGNNNQSLQYQQIIHNITAEKKFNWYGYYNTPGWFLKVEYYGCSAFNPVKDLMSVWQSNSINGKYYQCYEGHISHSIHFFSEFNWCGMDVMQWSNYSFRYPIPDDCGIDYKNKKYLCFANNIIWDESKRLSNNTKTESSSRSESYFHGSESIWDEKHMGSRIWYNCFIKKTKTDLEVDCCSSDIIVKPIHASNWTERNLNADAEEEVDLDNLKNNIRHCSSWIDWWKEEIERRRELNLPKLKFEKISNQGVYTWTEDYMITHPEVATHIVKNNFQIHEHIAETSLLYCNIYLNEDSLSELINYKKPYKNNREFSMNYYKKKYLMSLSHSREGDNDNDDNDNDQNGNEMDFNEGDFSCFKASRSISERSIPNASRLKILNQYTTKQIDECFEIPELSQSQGSDKDNIGNKYSLLANKTKLSLAKHTRERTLNTIKFYTICNNLFIYSYTQLSENKVLGAKIKCKLINNHFHFDWNCNRHLHDIHYSNLTDFNWFAKRVFKVNEYRWKNKKALANQSVSIEMLLKNRNKITKNPAMIVSRRINSRRNIIKNKLKTYSMLSEYKEVDQTEKLFLIEHCNWLYVDGWRRITYGDIKRKWVSKEKMIAMKVKLNNEYFDNISKSGNKGSNSSNTKTIERTPVQRFNRNDISVLEYSYYNEVSPITQKKHVPHYSQKYASQSPITVPKRISISPDVTRNASAIKPTRTNIEKIITNMNSSFYNIASIEVFTNSISNWSSNYEKDNIIAISLVIHDENAEINMRINTTQYNYYSLLITTYPNKNITKRYNYANHILTPEYISYKRNDYDYSNVNEVIYEKDEISWLMKFVDIILKYDPDIIIGYETETLSIGYIMNRSEHWGYPLSQLISRLNPYINNYYDTIDKVRQKISEKWFERLKNKKEIHSYKDFYFMDMKFGKVSHVKGRIILNWWRIINDELKVNDYSFENVVFNLLKFRVAKFEQTFLLHLYHSKVPKNVGFALYYFILRAKYNLLIMKEQNIVTRCIQFIKIYGIDFESSWTRGTQYRVEGVMARWTKYNNYVLWSASKNQWMTQDRASFQPIVLEPPKNIIYNPVIVVDFQSLYPSIMIGYNICYSTCWGVLKEGKITIPNTKKFGVYVYNNNLYDQLKFDFERSPQFNQCINQSKEDAFLCFIRGNCFLAPNGALFVKKNIREGILPIILKELLLTRIMIKRSMKWYPEESNQYKSWYNRQWGIKLWANVTYGYTSAGFSGRMPDTDIGDAIVSWGKQIWLSSKDVIETKKEWCAKVIYGDTDSWFISVDNKSIIEAIEIGKEMAEVITKNNPEPIKLQFEKVYCPLIFNSKKHYSGYKYEDVKEVKANKKTMDTKGIEVVRRDTCEVISRIIEKTIKILFEQKDLSVLKRYIYRTYDKIISGKIIVKEFIYSKEVKFGMYKNLPPSAQVAFNWYKKDNAYVAAFGQRIPYIVYYNPLGYKTLKDSVISPSEYFENNTYTINSEYYIECINTVWKRFWEPINIDIMEWFYKYKRPIVSRENVYANSNYASSAGNSEESDNESKASLLSSKYQWAYNTKRKNILSFFNETWSKTRTVQREEMKSVNDKIGKYRERVDLQMKGVYDKMKEENEKIEYLFKWKKREMLLRKKREIESICAKCANVAWFNLEIENIPCVEYGCKLFYEKRYVNYALSEDGKGDVQNREK